MFLSINNKNKIFKWSLIKIIMKLLKSRRGRKSFKREFKRQVKYAIAAAVGFIIAFAWRDAIYNSTRTIIEKFTESSKDILINFYTSIFITIIGVLIIIISSKLLRD
jgi:multisubunit Na+/H+ antiporter MnhB subunit